MESEKAWPGRSFRSGVDLSIRRWLALMSGSPVTRCRDKRKSRAWMGESSVVRVESVSLTCHSSKAPSFALLCCLGATLSLWVGSRGSCQTRSKPLHLLQQRALCSQPCPGTAPILCSPSHPAAGPSTPWASVSPAHHHESRAPGRIRTTFPAPYLKSAWPCFATSCFVTQGHSSSS